MVRRRPSTRIISSGSAGRGGGLFTVHVTPDDYTLQSGPVEETDQGQQAQQKQGDVKTMNEAQFAEGAGTGAGPISVTGGTYTPDEDLTATLEDGRTIQLAVKGTPIPLAQAVAYGLIDAKGNKVGPTETKETPSKSSKPAAGSAPSQSGDTTTSTDTTDTEPAAGSSK